MFRRGGHEVRTKERATLEGPEAEAPRHGPGAPTVEGQSRLAKGSKVTGTVVAGGSIQVDGELEGRIEAEGDVILSPGSHVRADIEARNVTMGGQYRGNIVVENRAELAQEARVEGDITCPTLVVAEGAWFEGQLSMGKPPEARATSRP